MKFLFLIYVFVSIVIVVFSYGFTDPNIQLSQNPLFVSLHAPLHQFVYSHTGWAAVFTAGILVAFFFLYLALLRRVRKDEKDKRDEKVETRKLIVVAILLILAYPMFSYDVFNYIATAKLTFFWKENPYVVMPIEIPNEPNLAFTRAANKLALYGPTWITATFLPALVGFQNIWLSIMAFKTLVVIFYGLMLWLIWRITKSWWNVVFFGFNPLVLSEVLINGHNDVVMLVLALTGLLLSRDGRIRNRLFGYVLFIASVFVKGATIVLVPLFFIHWPMEKLWKAGFWLMFGVFLLTPLREELYPWYAVWFLTFAAFIPRDKAGMIHAFCIALSLGLVLRHIPYILTREYGGLGPMLRIFLTAAPVGIYLGWRGIRTYV